MKTTSTTVEVESSNDSINSLNSPEEKRKPNWEWRQPKGWQKKGLRLRATALAIAIGIIPIAIAGSTVVSVVNRSLGQYIKEDQLIRTKFMADLFGQFMLSRYTEAELIAKERTFTYPRLWKQASTAEKKAILDRFQELGGYDSIVFFDLQGNPLFQSDSNRPFIGNYSDHPYYKQAIDTKSIAINDFKISKSSGKLSIELAAPVLQNGEVFGVIRLRTATNSLNQVFSNFNNNKDVWHLVNNEGALLATAADHEVYLNLNATENWQGLKKLIGSEQPHVGFYLNEEENNDQELVSYVPIPSFGKVPPLKAAAMITKDATIAFAPQTTILTVIWTGILSAAAGVGILAIFLVKRATRPILDAARAVEKIGQGELNTRVQVQGQNELAILSANINEMAMRLETLVREQSYSVTQSRLLVEMTSAEIRDEAAQIQVFSQALDAAREMLGTCRVAIYQFNPSGSNSIPYESLVTGYESGRDIIQDTIPKQVLQAYENGKLEPTNIMECNLHPEELQLMERLEIKTNLVVPIRTREQLYGLLVVHCVLSHSWLPYEVKFLSALGIQLGILLDRLSFLRALDESKSTAETLAEQQRQLNEQLQSRAIELLMEVDPVSHGDLTIRASVTKDEIGTIADSYNNTIESLRKIVTTVQMAAGQVAMATSDNEAMLSTLSTDARRQVGEMAVALERIQAMGTSSVDVRSLAAEAQEAVREATETVAAGDEAMNRTVMGIKSIRDTVAETGKKVKRLGESSQKISKVVNLISSFAEQTNLLALNASIEAAHAGEEGRGFAVVASSVRSLARQSADATAEIASLVAEIQSETNEVVAAMESGTEQVVTGTTLVAVARQNLNQITAASAQIEALVEMIALRAVSQSEDSAIVKETMTDVAATSENTLKSAQIVSASFKELLTVAEDMQAGVGRFKVK